MVDPPYTPATPTSAAASPDLSYARATAFQSAVRPTLHGIALLGAAVGLAAAQLAIRAVLNLPFSSGEILLGAFGFALLFMHPAAMGVSHRRFVHLAVGTALLAALAGAALAFLNYVEVTGWESHAEGFRSQVLRATIYVLVASVSIFLATYRLQDAVGRLLLVAGLVAIVAIQAYLWFALNDAIDRALVAANAAGSYEPFIAIPDTWSRLESWNAAPLVLFVIAYERLYWQLRRRYFAGQSFWNV